MNIRTRLYKTLGYQEPWPPETEPSTMEIVVVEVELESDSGERKYTVGRLFFPPEQIEEFGESIALVVVDEREKEPSNV